MHLCAEILIVVTLFFQTSFMYASKRSGSNTKPCDTPDLILTSSDNCPHITNSLRTTHTTNIKSTPEAAIFVISRSQGTKSKHFENYIIISSILTPSSMELPVFWQSVTTWLWHEYPALKPCWTSHYHSIYTRLALGILQIFWVYPNFLHIKKYSVPLNDSL